VPDFGLTRRLVDAAEANGVHPFVGPVATVDVFYNPDEDYVTKWRARGVLGFEMEAAALFFLAGRAQGAGSDVRAACVLTVSDTLSEEETSEATYLALVDLEAATDRMIRIALEAGTSA
jgi:purine-nucleoside phosphorylase